LNSRRNQVPSAWASDSHWMLSALTIFGMSRHHDTLLHWSNQLTLKIPSSSVSSVVAFLWEAEVSHSARKWPSTSSQASMWIWNGAGRLREARQPAWALKSVGSTLGIRPANPIDWRFDSKNGTEVSINFRFWSTRLKKMRSFPSNGPITLSP
jgi:hypothetical protein